MIDNFKSSDGPAVPLAMSAQELALKRNPIDTAPDTTAVFRLIRESRGLPKCAHGSEGNMVEVTGTTVDLFVFSFDETIVPEETLAKLKELNSRMVAIHDKFPEVGADKVSAYLFAERDAVHAAQAAGQVPGEVHSREHVAQNFAIRRAGLRNQLIDNTHNEVVPLCKPILEAFARCLEQKMRQLETDERALNSAYGLRHEPSLIWKAMATCAARYSTRRLPGPHAWAFPAHLLEGIVTL